MQRGARFAFSRHALAAVALVSRFAGALSLQWRSCRMSPNASHAAWRSFCGSVWVRSVAPREGEREEEERRKGGGREEERRKRGGREGRKTGVREEEEKRKYGGREEEERRKG